ncbi:hypothetical protein Pcinc_017378 [Petrolisthes cinctipes]|uniref:Uncharacterized protein n=1 Tax=Petrolisthes cinctipes TaxID=88211 RepID=A0AAE1FQF8_PETCI|nr:hypothetical protein Pcinc_017378 [Petrolisthes cinctipes]
MEEDKTSEGDEPDTSKFVAALQNLTGKYGNECSLFSARVNGRWVGEGASGITYGLCYSTWYAHNDITKSIVASSSSSILKPNRQPEFAYDGYYCFKVDGYCFSSSFESAPNWNADLGTTQDISSIKILTRGDGMSISTFQNIMVKFGDSSVYSDNPPFGSYSGPSPPEGTTVIITSPMPVTGQYLQIASSNTIYLVICEVQIIG